MKPYKQVRKFRDYKKEAEEAGCYYCKLGGEPDYKETLKLKRFITDKGKIINKSRTGTCSYHQRKLTVEIKKARFTALIPYTDKHSL